MPFAIILKLPDAAPFAYFILRRNGLDPRPTQFAIFYGKGPTGLPIFFSQGFWPAHPHTGSIFCIRHGTAKHRHALSAIDLCLENRGTFLDPERPVQSVDLGRQKAQLPHSFFHLVVRKINSGTVVQDVLHPITAVTIQLILGRPHIPPQPLQNDLLFLFRKVTEVRRIVFCLDLVVGTVVINVADHAADVAAFFKSPHSVYLLLALQALLIVWFYELLTCSPRAYRQTLLLLIHQYIFQQDKSASMLLLYSADLHIQVTRDLLP